MSFYGQVIQYINKSMQKLSGGECISIEENDDTISINLKPTPKGSFTTAGLEVDQYGRVTNYNPPQGLCIFTDDGNGIVTINTLEGDSSDGN